MIEPSQVTSERTRSTQAPGQYFGYSIQSVRMLARLLDAEFGDTISLEVFEDVGVDTAGGEKTAEQVTSSRSGNPISDRSPKLWKTFNNWTLAAKQGELDPNHTRFVLYVAQGHSGHIAESFDAARSNAEAAEALAAVRRQLMGGRTLSKETDAHVQRVFETEGALLTAIIRRFCLLRGSGNPIDDVRSILRKHPISLPILDHVIEKLLGWVQRRIMEQLAQGQPATVCYDDFRVAYGSTVRKYDRLGPLPTLAPRPGEVEILASVADSTLIRQLEIIHGTDEEKLQAATDFLWASAQRTKWSELGEVHPSSFDDLEEKLQRIWRSDLGKALIAYKTHSEEDLGKLLFHGCMECQCNLKGREVPPYFVPGCFHALADVETIGWHPRFRELLHANPSRHRREYDT